jgi:hypothetical protein
MGLVGRMDSRWRYGEQIRKNEMEKTFAMHVRVMPTEF